LLWICLLKIPDQSSRTAHPKCKTDGISRNSRIKYKAARGT
jgi:hypothetical protein